MANRRKKRNRKSFKITFAKILGFLIALGAVIFLFGRTDENMDKYRYENIASRTIEEYKETRGTRENAITRSTSITNDLIAMDLDPNVFIRVPSIGQGRPTVRVIALAEYHFLRDGEHLFRKFVYLHVPNMFDNTILNQHIRFQITYQAGPNEQNLMFDTRGGNFGYNMNWIKSWLSRGMFVIELDLDFQLTQGTRTTSIYSIDRMNALGTLVSRNDQTTYMGDGITEPFRATYVSIMDEELEHNEVDFAFNSHVFILENSITHVVPTRSPDGQGHLWEGSGGWLNDIVYRPHLFFFNFNTQIDIDRILNLRLYFEYRIRERYSRNWFDPTTTRTVQDWRPTRDSYGNIGRTVRNAYYSPSWMNNTNLEFQTITTPASNRFTAGEFDDFEINRNLFDRYQHSLLIHSGVWRDQSAALGWSESTQWTEVRDIDITSMVFESNGRKYTARVDITEDTGYQGQVPPPNHDEHRPGIGGIGDFIRNIPNHIGDFFGWIGTTINSALTNLFDGLGPEGTALVIIALIIKIILVIVAIRVALPIFIRTKTGGKAG